MAGLACPSCGSTKLMDVPDSKAKLCYACRHEFVPDRSVAPLRIFLSYGHDANEELVRRIKSDLEARGHDVWFDKSEIKAGDDWRRSITDGIVGSDKFLSFLSKHSTRDPGVCRDEIAIALGVKGGNVQTILVESERDVQPPASISHIQWLDMHDWKERRIEGEAAWETWYQAKLAEIVSVVESDESRRFAGEIETLARHLKPIAFESRVSQLLSKGFVGRHWLFDAVEEWRGNANSTSRLFWVIGPPGVGKSAFAAQLTHTRGDVVAAAQFCEWDKPDHRNADRVIRSIAFQLAARLPDYRKLLLTLTEIGDLDRKNASELFDYLLVSPLERSIEGGRGRLLIVIDALDEAAHAGLNPLVDLLAKHASALPKWLGLVVTSRPELDVRVAFQALNPVPLDAHSEANSQDLQEFLREQLREELASRAESDSVVRQIAERSEGIFLYAERFCDGVRSGDISLDSPASFPRGLGGVYVDYFRRRFSDIDKYGRTVRPALRAILAAREPLPVQLLRIAFDWQEEELRDFLRPLASLFPLTREKAETVRPYHKSLSDWLTDESKAGGFYVSLLEGHRSLAEAGWNEYLRDAASMSDYSVRHLRAHLSRIGDGERRAKLERDAAFVARLRTAGEQVVRVFVSSTFRDMHRERDYLARYVFPELRERFEIGGVALNDVDLRWGIPQEDVDADRAIEIALEEIDRCRPYFIGLVGERYGWIPYKWPSRALERFPWLSQLQGRSTFEAEAIYGALDPTFGPTEAAFYFRDPATTASAGDPMSFGPESPATAELLGALKQRIRHAAASGRCSLREGFASPAEFGDWVVRDLEKKVSLSNPMGTVDAETARHWAFARRQLRSYEPREDHVRELDAAIRDTKAPVVVVGEIGLGKTSLIADWLLRRQDRRPFEVLLPHFAGSVPESVDFRDAILRMTMELRRRCFLPMADNPGAPQASFHESLRAATEVDDVTIVLDEIEAFHEEAIAWAASIELPRRSALILTTSSSEVAGRLVSRGLQTIRLQPLTVAERVRIVERTLAVHGKRLSSRQVERIAATPRCANAFFLATLLEQLRLSVQRFDEVETALDQCLGAASASDLLQLALERLENDFGAAFVENSLGLLAESPHGATEAEILERARLRRAGSGRAEWAAFAVAIRSWVNLSKFRYRIVHPLWKEAVMLRYRM